MSVCGLGGEWSLRFNIQIIFLKDCVAQCYFGRVIRAKRRTSGGIRQSITTEFNLLYTKMSAGVAPEVNLRN